MKLLRVSACVFHWSMLPCNSIQSSSQTKEFLMQRREFLTAGSVGLAALTTAAALNADATAGKIFDIIEVRKYTVKNAEKRTKLVEILDKALIPALNRLGIKPIGVFTPIAREEKYALNVFVVTPQKEHFYLIRDHLLLNDAEYRKNAAPIFETTSKDPVYTDCETFLLRSFPSIPELEVPQLGPDRVFELRFYRSFNIERNAAKIRMFDEGGELPLFREVGLMPVFFGDVIAGNRMPALMYMVGTPSLEKHAELWRTFVAHPKWAAMKDLPEYADTATEIERVVLTPSSGSQI